MMKKILIGGHRGSGCTDSPHARTLNKHLANPPENTLESIRAALNNGADFIECDVVSAQDGGLMVIHSDLLADHVFSPLTRQRVGECSQRSLAALGVGPQMDGHIPQLGEVLALVAGFGQPGGPRPWLNLEIKDTKNTGAPPPDTVWLRHLVDSLQAGPLPVDRLILSSFALADLVDVRALWPQARLAWLTDAADKPTRPIYAGDDSFERSFRHFSPEDIKQALSQVDLCALHPEISSLNAPAMALAVEHDLAINSWFLNELTPRENVRFVQRQLDLCQKHQLRCGVISDYVAEMISLVSACQNKSQKKHRNSINNTNHHK